MKITLVVTAVALFSFTGRAQDFFYNFSYFPDTYTELSGAQAVTTFDEDGFSAYAQFGFDFPYFDLTMDELSFFYDGVFVWNDHLEGGLDGYLAQLFPFAAGYSTNDSTTMEFKIEGTPGNHIFKGQWKNMSLGWDTLGTQTANFQLWLYEADGAIEVRSGYMNIVQEDCYFTEEQGGFTCLVLIDNYSGYPVDQTFYLADSAQHPQMQFFQTDMGGQTVIGCMPSNFVYRFVPKNASIKENELNFSLYPNPAKETLTIVSTNKSADVNYSISDLSGKIIASGSGTSPDISELATGTYLITVEDGTSQSTQPFVKH